MAQLRAERKMEVACKGFMPRGGRDFGKMILGAEQMSWDADRRRHANNLAPLEQQKAWIESQMLNIESVVAQLESYILQHSEPFGVGSQRTQRTPPGRSPAALASWSWLGKVLSQRRRSGRMLTR